MDFLVVSVFLLDVVTTSRRVIGDENDDEEIDETEASEEVGEEGAIIIVFIRHDDRKGFLLVPGCDDAVLFILFPFSVWIFYGNKIPQGR